MGTEVSRAALTPAAADLLRKLYAANGPLMFHQSGGCCDGSSPMCYAEGEFRTGASDVLLAALSVEAKTIRSLEDRSADAAEAKSCASVGPSILALIVRRRPA